MPINMIRILLVVVLSFVWVALTAHAQGADRLPRIGFLGNSTATLEANLIGPFRDGLRDLGYVEGQNILIEYQWAEGKYERFPTLIAELIARKVDVIVTAGPPASLAVKKATTSVPLVMIAVGDPVGTGLVASRAKPGGNLTGPSTQRHDIDPKLLQLTKELLPELRRLCLLYDGRPQRNLRDYAENEFRVLARNFGVSVCMIPIRSQGDVEAVPRIIEQQRPQA